MLEKLKYAGKQSLLYSLGTIAPKVVGFILLPFYTSYLSLEEYGILTLLEVILQISLPIVSMYIQSALLRFAPEYKDDRLILSNAFFFTIFVGSIYLLVLSPFSGWLAKELLNSYKYKTLVQITLINIFLLTNIYVLRSFLNYREKALLFNLVNWTLGLFQIIFILYLLIVKKMGLWAVAYGQLFAYAITLLLIIIFIFKLLSLKIISFPLIGKMVKFSLPLAFSQISNQILTFGDRVVLKFLNSLEIVGIYSLALKIANIVDMLISNSFQLAYKPYAFKNFNSSSFRFFHSKMTTYLTFILAFSLLPLVLFSKELLYLISPKNNDYWLAIEYLWLVALLKPLGGLRFMFGLGLQFAKKTVYVPVIVISAAVLNILLNIALIPPMGVYGAILSSMFSMTLLVLLYVKISLKFYKIKYEYLRIFYIFAISALFYAGYKVNFNSIFLTIIIKFSFLIIYPAFLWITGFFRNDEKEVLLNFFQNFLLKIQKRSNEKDKNTNSR